MKRGSAIKYTRTIKGIKQKDLITNTHSRSLISRIENNDSEVQDGHYDYFIEKLGIDFPKLLKDEELIESSIEELFTHIHYLQLEDAKKQLDELMVQDDFIKFSDYYMHFQIVKFFYFIQINDMTLAETVWNEIQKQKGNLLSHEVILSEFFYAIYLVFKGEYKDAYERFSKFLNSENQRSFVNRGDLYFYASKAKTGLHDNSNATFLATKAASYYNEQFNYKRGIITAELLINLYNSSEMYTESSKLLKKLFRFESILQLLPTELPIFYHLQGTVYKKTGQIEKAIDYYRKSIEFPQPLDHHLLLMQFNYCELLFSNNDEKCREQLSKLFMLANAIRNNEYIILSKFYQLMLENEKEAIDYIEKNIDILGSPKMNLEAKSTILLYLSNYYTNLKNADKAIMYINQWKMLKK